MTQKQAVGVGDYVVVQRWLSIRAVCVRLQYSLRKQ